MEFKHRIKELRKKEGWTQVEMAKRLGVTDALVSQWESGKRMPSFEMIEALGDLFHTDLNYMIGHEDYVARLSGDGTDPDDGVKVLISTYESKIIYAWRHADDQTRRIVAYALKIGENLK